MARYTGPKHKLCRVEGVAICGSANCPVVKKNAGPPGQHGPKGRKKLSEYGIQLREKQKVKRMYGLMEKQFRRYYDNASRTKAATGEALLSLLETRLDNVVYRLNLASSRQQARQLVSHGHVTVNGKKVMIPSFSVKIGDIVTLSAKLSAKPFIAQIQQDTKEAKLPTWLAKKALVGKITALPKKEDIDIEVNERLIVEYYSR